MFGNLVACEEMKIFGKSLLETRGYRQW